MVSESNYFFNRQKSIHRFLWFVLHWSTLVNGVFARKTLKAGSSEPAGEEDGNLIWKQTLQVEHETKFIAYPSGSAVLALFA